MQHDHQIECIGYQSGDQHRAQNVGAQLLAARPEHDGDRDQRRSQDSSDHHASRTKGAPIEGDDSLGSEQETHAEQRGDDGRNGEKCAELDHRAPSHDDGGTIQAGPGPEQQRASLPGSASARYAAHETALQIIRRVPSSECM
jgi:hypothetical protein